MGIYVNKKKKKVISKKASSFIKKGGKLCNAVSVPRQAGAAEPRAAAGDPGHALAAGTAAPAAPAGGDEDTKRGESEGRCREEE